MRLKIIIEFLTSKKTNISLQTKILLIKTFDTWTIDSNIIDKSFLMEES